MVVLMRKPKAFRPSGNRRGRTDTVVGPMCVGRARAALAVCAAVAVPLSATGHHESNSVGVLVIGVVLFTVTTACLLRLVAFIILRLAGAFRAHSSGKER
jgi:hypothetical protein